jgi:ABC-type dipeptide/oligopeptide/nickel transport system permease component
MMAYFVRRMLGGAVTWLLATFLLYTFLSYGPGGLRDLLEQYWLVANYTARPIDIALPERVEDTYHLSVPWPANYGLWLYNGMPDPSPKYVDPLQTDACYDLYTQGKGDKRIRNRGILAGDWGESWLYCTSAPVLKLYGINLGPTLGISLGILLLSMLIVCLQRIGHHPYYHRAHSLGTQLSVVPIAFCYNRVC